MKKNIINVEKLRGAARFTHLLAKAGGGPKRLGGDGMEGGVLAIATSAAKDAIRRHMRSSALNNVVALKKKAK